MSLDRPSENIAIDLVAVANASLLGHLSSFSATVDARAKCNHDGDDDEYEDRFKQRRNAEYGHDGLCLPSSVLCVYQRHPRSRRDKRRITRTERLGYDNMDEYRAFVQTMNTTSLGNMTQHNLLTKTRNAWYSLCASEEREDTKTRVKRSFAHRSSCRVRHSGAGSRVRDCSHLWVKVSLCTQEIFHRLMVISQ